MEDYSNQNAIPATTRSTIPKATVRTTTMVPTQRSVRRGSPNKSVKGLKIMIVIMALILAALSAIYFLQVKQMRRFRDRARYADRQLLPMNDYDTLKR
ncbi:MAG: hypothetical protein ACLUEV_11985 [Alistipes sp.]